MTTREQNKQRSIRFGGDLELKIEQLAEQEDLTFSQQVKRLVRLGLRTLQQQQQQHSAAA